MLIKRPSWSGLSIRSTRLLRPSAHNGIRIYFAETRTSPPVPPDVDLAAARRLVTDLQDKPPLEETDTCAQWIMGPANPHGRIR
ncbi:hypothetical protein SAMN05216215_11161, partial [Saccharopolyspora shandongensis]